MATQRETTLHGDVGQAKRRTPNSQAVQHDAGHHRTLTVQPGFCPARARARRRGSCRRLFVSPTRQEPNPVDLQGRHNCRCIGQEQERARRESCPAEGRECRRRDEWCTAEAAAAVAAAAAAVVITAGSHAGGNPSPKQETRCNVALRARCQLPSAVQSEPDRGPTGRLPTQHSLSLLSYLWLSRHCSGFFAAAERSMEWRDSGWKRRGGGEGSAVEGMV